MVSAALGAPARGSGFIGATAVMVREAAGLSQVAASKRIGCSQGQLSKLEQEWTDPSAAIVEAMAKAYGQPVRHLLAKVHRRPADHLPRLPLQQAAEGARARRGRVDEGPEALVAPRPLSPNDHQEIER